MRGESIPRLPVAATREARSIRLLVAANRQEQSIRLPVAPHREGLLLSDAEGKAIDPALDARSYGLARVQAAPHDARNRSADEVGRRHEQQRLHEQRNHYSALDPFQAPRQRLRLVGLRSTAGQPADDEADGECDDQPPEQLGDEIVHCSVPRTLRPGGRLAS